MTRILVVAVLCSLVWIAGCGCGDRAASRQVKIVELYGYKFGANVPFEVDTSMLDPSIQTKRLEQTDSCGAPISTVEFTSDRPIKILIVPAAYTPTTNSAQPADKPTPPKARLGAQQKSS
jgi:hypothetical protein